MPESIPFTLDRPSYAFFTSVAEAERETPSTCGRGVGAAPTKR